MKLLAQFTTAVRRIERYFGPDDDWVPIGRKIVYEAAQRVLTPLTSHSFTREKGTADYITTADAAPAVVEAALWTAGYQRNILSTWKYRTVDGERQDIVSAWVFDPEDTDSQHDVFLFPNGKQTDVYGHREPSVRNPSAHLDLSTGTHGDPDRNATTALTMAGIDFTSERMQTTTNTEQ